MDKFKQENTLQSKSYNYQFKSTYCYIVLENCRFLGGFF
jgi:hypothetical protein